jgi:hypothetical protein
MPDNGRRRILLTAVFAAIVAAPTAASAQDGFFFRPPTAGLTLRVGPMLYNASSDVFDEMKQNLTLSGSSFTGPAYGLDFVFMQLPRVDIVVGLGYAQSSASSEFRDWVEQDAAGNELPIEQTTRMRTIPLTASARYQLLSRGRSVSRLAWLPRSTMPYIGGGGGAVWYRLQQRGDFVDMGDFSIFFDTIESSGIDFTVHALAGVDHWFTARTGLNAEARYTHGQATPNNGFLTFDSLDLGGLQFTLGFSVRW